MKLTNFYANIAEICGLKSSVEKGHAATNLLSEQINKDTKGAGILSNYLGYSYFDSKRQLFFNDDDSCGFLFEVMPIVGLKADLEKNLTLFFNNELPTESYLQFLLVGSHHIDDKLAVWEEGRQKNPNELLKLLTFYRKDFIKNRAQDFAASDGRMSRDWRIYVSFSKQYGGSKSKINEIAEFRKKLEKKLFTIGLSPRALDAQGLMYIVSDLVQPEREKSPKPEYNPYNTLSNQVLTPLKDTVINPEIILYNSKNLASKCFYVQGWPEEFSLLEMIGLLGSGGDHGIPARVVISYTVANNINVSNAGSIIARGQRIIDAAEQVYTRHDLNLKDEALEWREIMARHKSGERFLSEQLTVMIASTQSDIDTAQEAIVSLYNSRDFQLRINTNLQLPSLLGLLPMNQAGTWQWFEYFKLTRLVQSQEVVAKLPIHCEWKGMDKSGVLLLARRGQLYNWNPFVKLQSGNPNTTVIAASGSGKSVFVQETSTSMLAQGVSVFILDIGASYQNICELLGGEMVRFNSSNNLSLNPFASMAVSGNKYLKARQMVNNRSRIEEISKATGLNTDEIEGLIKDKNVSTNPAGVDEGRIELLEIGEHIVTKDTIIYAKSIIAVMCGSKGDAHKEAVIEQAINTGIKEYGTDLDITRLAAILAQSDNRQLGLELSETLYPYTEEGIHGRFFKAGKSASFKKMLTVFEFEEIKNDEVLLSVVLQVILMQITMQFLCGDRSRNFLLVVDEAWMILAHSSGFLEAFVKTVRKYGGALITCVQNLSDFYKSDSRRAILENSAWTILLKQDEKGLKLFKESEAFEDIVPLIESISLVPGKYAEALICATGLKTIGRLVLDPYSQALYSTEKDDFKFISDAKARGMDTHEAVKQLATKYGSLPVVPEGIINDNKLDRV